MQTAVTGTAVEEYGPGSEQEVGLEASEGSP